ncbi:hypothetical protein JXA48_01415 [Candidatus Woesearchaeota archaeon]|nr:hypothetical protein [Candidatus Woesearchaeota archaeon]
MSSLDIIKSIGYILVLILVFSPLTFLVANTFVDGTQNTCYERYPYIQKVNATEEEQVAQNDKVLACQEEYNVQIQKEKTTVFVIVSILSIITLVVLLLAKNIAPIISYGLFFGVSINIIRLVWGFNEANSLVAAGLGIVLFVIALIFINKSISKKESTETKISKKK